MLKGEVAVMRVENVNLILDPTLPLIVQPVGMLQMTTYRLHFTPKDQHCQVSAN